MILIDTNVVSEPWKPAPSAAVLAWLDAQAIETLFLSAITVAELRYGIAALPVGKRRTILRDRLEGDREAVGAAAFDGRRRRGKPSAQRAGQYHHLPHAVPSLLCADSASRSKCDFSCATARSK